MLLDELSAHHLPDTIKRHVVDKKCCQESLYQAKVSPATSTPSLYLNNDEIHELPDHIEHQRCSKDPEDASRLCHRH